MSTKLSYKEYQNFNTIDKEGSDFTELLFEYLLMFLIFFINFIM